MQLVILHSYVGEETVSEFPGFAESYAHFVDLGKQHGWSVILGHHSRYRRGQLESGWIWDGEWRKVSDVKISFVHDRFSGEGSSLVRSDLAARNILVFNHPELESQTRDKLRSYEIFPHLIPSTIATDADGVRDAVNEMRSRDIHPDLSKERLFLKPREGHGAQGIIIIEKDIPFIPPEKYVLQPFLETADGVPELGIDGRHDFRIIIVNGVPRYAYLRIPPEGSLVSNVSVGGRRRYVALKDIPSSFLQVAQEISSRFAEYMPSIYAVDMGRGRSGKVWVFEINGRPSLAWRSQDSESEVSLKKELQEMVWSAIIRFSDTHAHDQS